MVRSQRWAVGSILIAHSFAHSMPGMRAMDGVPGWLLGQARASDQGLVIMAASLLAVAMGGLLAGGLGGTLKTGRTLDYLRAGDANRKMSSLFLSLMDRMGVSLDQFGDADTRLSGL